MRRLVLLLAVSWATSASADGLDAMQLATTDAQPLVTLGRFMTVSGGAKGLQAAGSFVTWPRSVFMYGSYDWSASSLEAGAGLRLDLVGPLKASGAVGGILVPRYGVSGGGRVSLGLSARFGEQLFFTPALGASLGVVSTRPVTWLLPVEASAQVGYAWRHISMFLRVALGAETLAGPLVSLRADASLGASFFLGEPDAD